MILPMNTGFPEKFLWIIQIYLRENRLRERHIHD